MSRWWNGLAPTMQLRDKRQSTSIVASTTSGPECLKTKPQNYSKMGVTEMYLFLEYRLGKAFTKTYIY
jgi:hypothetical protein